MSGRTITLSADLVERLETLAEQQGLGLAELFDDMLSKYDLPTGSSNWATTLAEHMENADIDWQEDPELSATSRSDFEDASYQRWKASQQENLDNE